MWLQEMFNADIACTEQDALAGEESPAMKKLAWARTTRFWVLLIWTEVKSSFSTRFDCPEPLKDLLYQKSLREIYAM